MYEWFQLNNKLLLSPRIISLACTLGCSKATALGHAVEWLSLLDTTSDKGRTKMKPEHIDLYVQCQGFAAALIGIGWAELDGDGNMMAVDYEQYNGQNTKARLVNSRRVAKFRNNKSLQAKQDCNGDTITDVMQQHYNCNGGGITDVMQGKGKSITKVMDSHYGGITDALPIHTQEQEHISSEANASEGGGICERERERERCACAGGDAGDFAVWLETIKQTHPACRRARKLTRDALAAARDAFERVPDAADDAAVLADFLADASDDGFFRPVNPATFFNRLEGTIENARCWAQRRAQKASDGFGQWLALLRAAHPALRNSGELSKTDLRAARDAYKRMPAASQYSDLLREYLDADGDDGFFRPYAIATFFNRIESTIDNATRWSRKRMAQAPDGFIAWLTPLMNAHPALRKSESLSEEVCRAALDAYKRIPDAREHADMLSAYYESRITQDKHKKDYFRPLKQDVFFSHLEEVITHAEAWARFAEWKRPADGSKKPAPEVQDVPALTPEQLQAYFSDLRMAIDKPRA